MSPTIFVNNLYISLFFCTFAVPILKRGLTGTNSPLFWIEYIIFGFQM